ncbi:hypothetical protein [Caballeronia sp. LZ016]|uniref:hypothetical protein n=1 Tax=Caballeronia sp. LZ016 TaxID=3038554 RepID=UPI0028624C4D|nr:hypothetical protein [Caballeronia sp. LZ016]MDR5737156.1 hypothetical protein [Caballeronia sp. LZ016]
MSIEVEDLIGLAQQLAAGGSECEWRSGASRAYYAAYHQALQVADKCLPPGHDAAGVHQRLTDRYIAHGKKGKVLAYLLIDLKKIRTLADYHLADAFDQHDATDLVANCVAFLTRADAFRSMAEADASATV